MIEQHSIVTQDVLENMVLAIVDVVKPEKIYLFGSVARGEATEGSDIDLLIVTEENFENYGRWSELRRIRHVLTPFPLSKDILLYSRDEMAYWQDAINHITTHAVREGKLLYERH
ncbi:MAG: nucleotidyltransferase domain-containing protein [Magnetococcales bacterium]|nr:nucleotidyltransferase domain-containing protein [Magnetococcales bacterium]